MSPARNVAKYPVALPSAVTTRGRAGKDSATAAEPRQTATLAAPTRGKPPSASAGAASAVAHRFAAVATVAARPLMAA